MIGIGVRIAIYVQAFFALIPVILKTAEDILIDELNSSSATANHVPTAVVWEDILEVVTPNVILGCALIISSLVQARTFGLTVYHALIVLNLSWIITFSVTLSIFKSNNDGKAKSSPGFKRMGCFYIVHLSFYASFALWMFTTIKDFDHTGTDCTSSTIFYLFGHHVLADNPHFRVFWLVIYSILVIPLINLIFVAVVFLVITVVGAVPMIPVMLVVSIIVRRQLRAVNTPRSLETIGMMSVPASAVFPIIIVIILTEKMITSNTVGPGENDWTFGQSLALFIAVPPAWGVIKQLKKTYRHIRDLVDVSRSRLLSISFRLCLVLVGFQRQPIRERQQSSCLIRYCGFRDSSMNRFEQ
jgi:hypothetical protein